MTDLKRMEAVARAVDAVSGLLDEMVADEASAMSVLAVALGERIGGFAISRSGLRYGMVNIKQAVEHAALRTFDEKQRAADA